jgi:hypothetical protein
MSPAPRTRGLLLSDELAAKTVPKPRLDLVMTSFLGRFEVLLPGAAISFRGHVRSSTEYTSVHEKTAGGHLVVGLNFSSRDLSRSLPFRRLPPPRREAHRTSPDAYAGPAGPGSG